MVFAKQIHASQDVINMLHCHAMKSKSRLSIPLLVTKFSYVSPHTAAFNQREKHILQKLILLIGGLPYPPIMRRLV
jgi:hypothetical protein